MDDSLMESASYLRRLVRQVPRPLPVEYNLKENEPSGEWPEYFGSTYHGELSTYETARLLLHEGSYLVRKGKNLNIATLSFRVNGSVHHYHLHYDVDGTYWVKPEKKFNILVDLVWEGLRVLYMDKHWHWVVALLQSELPEKVKHRSLGPYNTTGHEFKRTFVWFKRCAVCSQSAVFFTNLKCRECNMEIHERCVMKCKNPCNFRIFGVDLCKIVDLSKPERPFILEMCIEEIERRGLDAEGLYRVSGFSDEIESLKNAFERDGKMADLSSKTYENVHVLTGVLKKWLRMLPHSLIDESVRDDLFQALSYEGDYKRDLLFSKALKKLQPAQYSTLDYLLTHLRRVIDQDGNKMSSRNMALVLAPTLMPTNLSNLENNIKVVEIFLKRHQIIFQHVIK